MRILVTGSTGFLGCNILDYLEKRNIIAFNFSGDLRNKSTFKAGEYEYIIHSAALVDKKYWDKDQLFLINVDGTKKLIDYYLKSKVIFISSCDIINKPKTPYSQSKHEAEKIVIQNNNNLIIRLPSIFGPGDQHKKIIPLLFNKYLNNGKFQLYNNHMNSYVFVKDVVKFIYQNLNKTGLLEMNGTSIPNYDLDKMIKSICNKGKKPVLKNKHIDFYANLKKCKNYYIK